MKPKLVRTLAALRRETAKWRKEGLSYAVVPTMGAILIFMLAFIAVFMA